MHDSEQEPPFTDADVRSLQILSGALPMGAVLFVGTVVFLARSRPETPLQEGAVGFIQTLTGVSAVLTVQALVVGVVLFGIMTGAKKVVEADDEGGFRIRADAIANLRVATLVRLASLEAAALMGTVALFLSMSNGVMQAHDWVWVNVLPTMVFVFFALASFPTHKRVSALFESRLETARIRGL